MVARSCAWPCQGSIWHRGAPTLLKFQNVPENCQTNPESFCKASTVLDHHGPHHHHFVKLSSPMIRGDRILYKFAFQERSCQNFSLGWDWCDCPQGTIKQRHENSLTKVGLPKLQVALLWCPAHHIMVLLLNIPSRQRQLFSLIHPIFQFTHHLRLWVFRGWKRRVVAEMENWLMNLGRRSVG